MRVRWLVQRGATGAGARLGAAAVAEASAAAPSGAQGCRMPLPWTDRRSLQTLGTWGLRESEGTAGSLRNLHGPVLTTRASAVATLPAAAAMGHAV
jgi:hypothetical protein